MFYSFKNKIALVTGSSQGIGKSILTALALEGCNVILHCFKSKTKAKKIAKVFKKNNINISIYSADLTNEKEAEKMFLYIRKKHKKLDILINNVGEYLQKNLAELKIKDWHSIIDSNLNSAYYCTHYALPLLRKSQSGRIVNIGYASSGQIIAKPSILPYQISKTGILLMTKAYALSEAKNKILINMISPGIMENTKYKSEKEIPLNKKGKLKDLAKLVIQAIENDYMTGAHIEYAGGFNL